MESRFEKNGLAIKITSYYSSNVTVSLIRNGREADNFLNRDNIMSAMDEVGGFYSAEYKISPSLYGDDKIKEEINKKYPRPNYSDEERERATKRIKGESLETLIETTIENDEDASSRDAKVSKIKELYDSLQEIILKQMAKNDANFTLVRSKFMSLA